MHLALGTTRRSWTEVSVDTFVQSTTPMGFAEVHVAFFDAKGEKVKILAKTLIAVAVGVLVAIGARSETATSLVVPVANEPLPRLFVEPPLRGSLASGVGDSADRVEKLRMLPIGGPAAPNVSPRVGHLHITVDDLPWQHADYGQSNTIILVNLPRGKHKVPVQVVDREGWVFTAQTLAFRSPGE